MKFSEEILTVLDYLGHKFGIAIDWTSENVMPYLQDLASRYIKYEVFTSIAWIALFVVIIILAGFIWTISGIVSAKCVNNDIAQAICYMSMAVFWIAFALCIIVGMTQVYDIIECYTLPEKVILEYLKTLLNTTPK
jgi:hypothetical protein